MTLFPMDFQFELSSERVAHERIFLGSAGWSYDDWDGPFYPEKTSQKSRLSYYASQFRSVEIDSTFYGTPTEKTVQGWYERTPDDFVFAAKFPSVITHQGRLLDTQEETFQFIEVMSGLDEKLGPLLLQFPPSYSAEHIGDLAAFFSSLPKGLMYAVEVRHKSWLTDAFAALLEDQNVTLCMSCGGAFQKFWRTTSRVAYIRWLGKQKDFDTFESVRKDRTEDLEWWTPRIQHFAGKGGAIFGFVNNHYAGHSPGVLRQLSTMLAGDSNDD